MKEKEWQKGNKKGTQKTRGTFLYMAMKEESFKIVPHNAYFINMSEN